MDKLVVMGQWLLHNGPGLIVVIMCFGFIIFIHELGHFLMAKRAGVRVPEFALGFPPRLISIQKDEQKKWRFYFLPFLFKKKVDTELTEANQDVSSAENTLKCEMDKEKLLHKDVETVYSLGVIPFGGFVSMEGEDTEAPVDEKDPWNFQNKTIWQRIKIIACGPLMNYTVPLLLFWIVGFAYGVGGFYIKAQIGEVMKDTPAEKIGLKSGDYIVEIDGMPMSDARIMIETIHAKPDQEITIKVQRGEGESAQFFTHTVRTIVKELPGKPPERIGIIGFAPNVQALTMRFVHASPQAVIIDGIVQMYRFTVTPLYAMYHIFSTILKGDREAKKDAVKMLKEGSGGPILIGQMFFEMYKRGFGCLLYLCAVINVLIGCFNLVPFPALDGSRIFILGISGLVRKPFDKRKEGLVHLVGFIILITVVIFFSINDIIRLIQGRRIF